MKAVIFGVEVKGTPVEIAEFKRLLEKPKTQDTATSITWQPAEIKPLTGHLDVNSVVGTIRARESRMRT